MKEMLRELEPYSLRDRESDGLLGYWVKGHHHPILFCEAVEYFEGEIVHPNQVRHEYWRVVVNQLVKTKSGRGAFPVTCVYF